MMPVIRISDATYARLQKYAKPFEDSPDSVITKALTALDMMSGDAEPVIASAPSKRIEGPKLPQKEFRIPLLVTLLDLGGTAPAKAVREKMEPLMAPRLAEGDYESVSTGDPRWWNAVCWERSDLVKEGLMRENSPRGVWEISDEGKALPTSYHSRRKGSDKMIDHGSLDDMARKYRETPSFAQDSHFLMVGDTTFQREPSFNATLLMKVANLQLSDRSATCLRNENIVYLGDLVRRSQNEMLRTPNFGRRSLNEIQELLRTFHLHLGMDVPNWPPENIEALANAYEDASTLDE